MNGRLQDKVCVITGTGGSIGRAAALRWMGGRMGGVSTSGGRFCNVFRFRDERIASLHIYLDSDCLGEDEPRFRWGKQRNW